MSHFDPPDEGRECCIYCGDANWLHEVAYHDDDWQPMRAMQCFMCNRVNRAWAAEVVA